MKVLCCLWLLAIIPLHGQRVITVDWSDKTLSNAPTNVDSPMQVKLRVIKVNDFLYTYEAKIKYDPKTAESITFDEWTKLGFVASKSNACNLIDAHASNAKDMAEAFVLKPDKDGAYPSTPLKVSQKDWDKLEPEYQALENASKDERGCASYIKYVGALQAQLRDLAKVSKGDHEFTSDHVLPGDGQYTIEVKESYKTKVTTGGAYTASFYARSSIFFLSVGYLGSQLQNRSYDAVDVATGTKTLRIQGTGAWRPTAAVLLNYKLPWWPKLNGEKAGLAISVGPVFRAMSSQTGSTATNWGAFAGLSVYLWGRLVLTPGVHLGEFSDMPLGFDNNHDRSIPAGVANPITGVNRWTSRFGIGITFQAADFKKAAALATFTPAAKEPAPDPAAAAAAAQKAVEAEKAKQAAEAETAKQAQAAAAAQKDADKAALKTAEETLKAAHDISGAKEELRKKIEAAADAETDPGKKQILNMALTQANADATAASIAVVAAQKAVDDLKAKVK